MATYKVTYFNCKARAELTRLILSYAGIEFEDERIAIGDWAAFQPIYKLTYFCMKARAELVRLMLSFGGIDFEDERVALEDWEAFKPKTPFGLLPMMTIDGQILCQSGAMHRYLARKLDLYGKDDWEQTQCDVVLETIQDLQQEFNAHWYANFESDTKKKEEVTKKLLNDMYPRFLKFMDKMLKDQGSGYLVGTKMSVADIAYFDIQERLASNIGECTAIKDFPELLKLYNEVECVPGIKKWLEKRPNTEV